MSESSLYPGALDSSNIYEVVARLSTTLTADITAATTTIPLASTTGFPTQGYIVIDNETIAYISVSVGSVDATGGRGHAGTAASHTSTTQVLVAVTAAVFNKLRAGLIAVQTKLGIGAGLAIDTIAEKTPGAGVTIEQVLIKDDVCNAYTVTTNALNEAVPFAGVTIDSLVIKDGDFSSSVHVNWAAVTAPTFNVAFYDNAAGLQPVTSENRMKISGNQCFIHYKGYGTKAGANTTIIRFDPRVYPAPVNCSVYSTLGIGSVVTNTGINISARILNIGADTWDAYIDAVIADNVTIDYFSFNLSYEI